MPPTAFHQARSCCRGTGSDRRRSRVETKTRSDHESDTLRDGFRIIVINVRGKTVVVDIGSYVLSIDEFKAFLPQADALLRSLRFPA